MWSNLNNFIIRNAFSVHYNRAGTPDASDDEAAASSAAFPFCAIIGVLITHGGILFRVVCPVPRV